jgi:hypothetical protein
MTASGTNQKPKLNSALRRPQPWAGSAPSQKTEPLPWCQRALAVGVSKQRIRMEESGTEKSTTVEHNAAVPSSEIIQIGLPYSTAALARLSAKRSRAAGECIRPVGLWVVLTMTARANADRRGAAREDHSLVKNHGGLKKTTSSPASTTACDASTTAPEAPPGEEHVRGGEVHAQLRGQRGRRCLARGLVHRTVGEPIGRGGHAPSLQRR